jgi:adenine deaminase
MANTGLSNYQTLRSATVEPARIMGVSNQLGTIAPGMIADMDIINGNPLMDMSTVANDVYVMQNGRLFTEQDLIGPYADGTFNTPPSASASAAQVRARKIRSLKLKWDFPNDLTKLGADIAALCE